jgi:hypothetical protein
MILDRTTSAALRTLHLMIGRPLHVDLDESLFHIQVDIGDEPRWNEAQE